MTDPDVREELASLAAALRVHVESARAAGATGFPAGAPIEEPAPATAAQNTSRGASPAPRSAPAAAPQSRGAASPAPRSAPAAAPSLAGTAAGRARLEVLRSEVAGCTRCTLHAGRKQTVFARGDGSSGLCFVGEGPGADEDEQGFPFVGKAGQLLDKMIEAMGFSRDEVYVCNIVKCRPPNNRKPEPDEAAACRPYLDEQLELVEPKVIVALGATAVEGLLGIGGGITRLRGTWRLYKGKVAVMPTFHPAYLLRTPTAKRDVWNDLQEVLRHMQRTVPGKK